MKENGKKTGKNNVTKREWNDSADFCNVSCPKRRGICTQLSLRKLQCAGINRKHILQNLTCFWYICIVLLIGWSSARNACWLSLNNKENKLCLFTRPVKLTRNSRGWGRHSVTWICTKSLRKKFMSWSESFSRRVNPSNVLVAVDAISVAQRAAQLWPHTLCCCWHKSSAYWACKEEAIAFASISQYSEYETCVLSRINLELHWEQTDTFAEHLVVSVFKPIGDGLFVNERTNKTCFISLLCCGRAIDQGVSVGSGICALSCMDKTNPWRNCLRGWGQSWGVWRRWVVVVLNVKAFNLYQNHFCLSVAHEPLFCHI